MAHVVNWRLDLMLSHPRLFRVMADEPHLSFGYPSCEAGWREILERLCGRIEAALAEGGGTVQFVRVRQKLGVLRVDWDAESSDETTNRVLDAVNLATACSACTCEICGAEGRLYSNRGWLGTRCAEHAAGDPISKQVGFENVRRYRRRFGTSDLYYARYDRETDTLTEIAPPARPDTEDR